MGSSKYKPNKLFPKLLMNSAPVRSLIDKRGREVKSVADGFGSATYAVKTEMGEGRAHTFVYTPSYQAMRENSKNSALIKAIKTARG